MFTLSVVFGSASVGFMFKSKEAVEKAADAISPKPPVFMAPPNLDSLPMNARHGSVQALQESTHAGSVVIEDDFGQRGAFNLASIHGVIVEDLELTSVARAEQMVHQARCQNKAAKLANADPALRMMNSPAVLNPMGNGQMR